MAEFSTTTPTSRKKHESSNKSSDNCPSTKRRFSYNLRLRYKNLESKESCNGLLSLSLVEILKLEADQYEQSIIGVFLEDSESSKESIRNALTLCLLLPRFSDIVEMVLPGALPVIYLQLFNRAWQDSAISLRALFFVLSSRLLEHPLLHQFASEACQANEILEAIYDIVNRGSQIEKLTEHVLMSVSNYLMLFPTSGLFIKLISLVQQSILSTSFISDNLKFAALNLLKATFRLNLKEAEVLAHLFPLSSPANSYIITPLNSKAPNFESLHEIEPFPAFFSNSTISNLLIPPYTSRTSSKISSNNLSDNPSETSLDGPPPETPLDSCSEDNLPETPTNDLFSSSTTETKERGITEDSNIALKQLAVATISKSACLVLGPSGSGKTFLIGELSRRFSAECYWLYLDRQIDSKTLLGCWDSGDIPGQFVWQDGALTRAMTQGRWVIIEDIDCISTDVMIKLHEILESRQIFIPERNLRIMAHPNFQLFGTSNSVIPELSRDWICMRLHAHSADEIVKICSIRFRNIPDTVISYLWDRFSLTVQTATATVVVALGGRKFNLKDFFRLCQRLHRRFITGQELRRLPLLEKTRFAILEEFSIAIASSIPCENTRETFCEEFAAVLSLSKENVQGIMKRYISPPCVEDNNLTVGSVSVPLNEIIPGSPDMLIDPMQPFIYTTVHSRVIEALFSAISCNEAVLLIGNTGTGKSSLLQHVATQLRHPISIYNFNDQSETSDLIGHTRPENPSSLVDQQRLCLHELLRDTGCLHQPQIAAVMTRLEKKFSASKWGGCIVLCRGVAGRVISLLTSQNDKFTSTKLISRWVEFQTAVENLSTHPLIHDNPQESNIRFKFSEGVLVQALREGRWLVLDEVNLAPSDLLQRLRGLLTETKSKFVVTENAGEEIMPHPAFRLFACMNPPLQITRGSGADISTFTNAGAGKKSLPSGIRDCFTEIFVDEVAEQNDLECLISKYVAGVNAPEVAKFYLEAKGLSENSELYLRINRSHISLRNLVRSLKFVNLVSSRALHPVSPHTGVTEALLANFATCLQSEAAAFISKAINSRFRSSTSSSQPKSRNFQSPQYSVANEKGEFRTLSNADCICTLQEENRQSALRYLTLNHAPLLHSCNPRTPVRFANISGHLVACGEMPIDIATATNNFIVTPTVHQNLCNLARLLSGGRVPILLEGPTSSGKSSLVKFLCDLTGHHFIRINNHEHTDVQEYLGQHITDPETGQLVFAEGAIATAARKGHWVVLDELNLASSEVLEALNRLLDDNRQLFIPETGALIDAHPDFMIFATQNPAGGAYGGRKMLSQALRNRFVEMFIDELPSNELETVVQGRCVIPVSFTKSMIEVYSELKSRRLKSSVFESSSGFMTIRDLLRWGFRRPESREALAFEGYCLVAERLRDNEEKEAVRCLLETKCLGGRNRKLEIDYKTDPVLLQVRSKLVEAKLDDEFCLTASMSRLVALVQRCISHNEPVLLVGETGAGKTMLCQVLAKLEGLDLKILNCHQHTEVADLLGCVRPVKDRSTLSATLAENAQAILTSLRDLFGCEVTELKFSSEDALSNNPACLRTLWKVVEKENSLITLAELKVALGEINEAVSRVSVLPLKSTINNRSEKMDPNPIPDQLSHAKRQRIGTDPSVSVIKSRISQLSASLLKNFESSQKLFEWCDGSLINSMKTGSCFLLDEISLADDAILERLNSVLEPGRSIILAEKGCSMQSSGSRGLDVIIAHQSFRIFATMNPGGDFGKRELSPALRNRFTEIFVSPITFDSQDTLDFIGKKLTHALKDIFPRESLTQLALPMADDMQRLVLWFNAKARHSVTVREVLYWVDFIRNFLRAQEHLGTKELMECFIHGAFLALIDPIGLGNFVDDMQSANNISDELLARILSLNTNFNLLKSLATTDPIHDKVIMTQISTLTEDINDSFANHGTKWIEKSIASAHVNTTMSQLVLGSFKIPCRLNSHAELLNVSDQKDKDMAINGADAKASVFFLSSIEETFTLQGPTILRNFGRLLRALQLERAILLEGPPGVGKTALVEALAKVTGNRLVRINLSEQTDLADLLGSDLPASKRDSIWAENDTDSDNINELFRWSDGVLIRAMKSGDWVVLDELNLATQQVLEGLNALLDHRRQVYLPDIDKTVECGQTFRLFATQNSAADGGGRKSLPRSFLNRFSRISVERLNQKDFKAIMGRLFSKSLKPEAITAVVQLLLSVSTRLYSELPKISFTTTTNVSTIMNRAIMDILHLCFFQEINRKTPLKGGNEWEWNLRDMLKLGNLIEISEPLQSPEAAASLLLSSRLRTYHDFYQIHHLIKETFSSSRWLLEPNMHCNNLLAEVEAITSQYEIDSTSKITRVQFEQCFAESYSAFANQIDPFKSSLIFKSWFSFEEMKAHCPANSNLVVATRNSTVGLYEQQDCQSRILCALSAGFPVLLSGPPSSGKASIVRHLAYQSSNNLEEIYLTENLDATELLGGYEPYGAKKVLDQVQRLLKEVWKFTVVFGITSKTNWNPFYFLESTYANMTKDKVQEVTVWLDQIQPLIAAKCHAPLSLRLEAQKTMAALQRALNRLDLGNLANSDATRSGSHPARFRWTDGQLLTSVQRGDWLLVRHVHFASAAVLDRLNSLLEPNGFILLAESGTPEIINPHPNFRIIFTSASTTEADLRLSKPLRNRCLEIYVGSRLPFNPNSDVIVTKLRSQNPTTKLQHLDPAFIFRKLLALISMPRSEPLMNHLYKFFYLGVQLSSFQGSFPLLHRFYDSANIIAAQPTAHFIPHNDQLILACMHAQLGLLGWCLAHYPTRQQLETLQSMKGLDIGEPITTIAQDCAASFDITEGKVFAEHVRSYISRLCDAASFRSLALWVSLIGVTKATQLSDENFRLTAWNAFQVCYIHQTSHADLTAEPLALKFLESLLYNIADLPIGHKSWSLIEQDGEKAHSDSALWKQVKPHLWKKSRLMRQVLAGVTYRASSDMTKKTSCQLRRQTTAELCESVILFLEGASLASWEEHVAVLRTVSENLGLFAEEHGDSVHNVTGLEQPLISRLRTCATNLEKGHSLSMNIFKALQSLIRDCLSHQSVTEWRLFIASPDVSTDYSNDSMHKSDEYFTITHAQAIVQRMTCASPKNAPQEFYKLLQLIDFFHCWIRLCFRFGDSLPLYCSANVEAKKIDHSTKPLLSDFHASRSLSLWDLNLIINKCDSSDVAAVLKNNSVDLDRITTDIPIFTIPRPQDVERLIGYLLQMPVQLAQTKSLLRLVSAVVSMIAMQQDEFCCLCEIAPSQHFRHSIVAWMKQLPKHDAYRNLMHHHCVAKECLNNVETPLRQLFLSQDNQPQENDHVSSDILSRLRICEPYASSAEFLLSKLLNSNEVVCCTIASLEDATNLSATLKTINSVKLIKGVEHAKSLMRALWKKLIHMTPNNADRAEECSTSLELPIIGRTDLYLILHLAHILNMSGIALLQETAVVPIMRLKLLTKFLLAQTRLAFAYLSQSGRRAAIPSVIDTISSIVSVTYVAEDQTHSNQNEMLRLMRSNQLKTGRMCIMKSQTLFAIVTNNSDMKLASKVHELLTIDSQFVNTLMAGEVTVKDTSISDEIQLCQANNAQELQLMSADTLFNWRTHLALNYCQEMSSNLTLGSLAEAKDITIYLQQLLNGHADIDVALTRFKHPDSMVIENLSEATGSQAGFTTKSISEAENKVMINWILILDWLKILLPGIVNVPNDMLNRILDILLKKLRCLVILCGDKVSSIDVPQFVGDHELKDFFKNLESEFESDCHESFISRRSLAFALVKQLMYFLTVESISIPHLEDKARILLAIIGCWAMEETRLNGGSFLNLLGRLANLAVEAAHQKQSLHIAAEMRRIASQFDTSEMFNDAVAQLYADAAVYEKVHATLSKKLPLRPPLMISDEEDGIELDQKRDMLLREKSDFMEGTHEQLLKEIRKFLDSFWKSETLTDKFHFLRNIQEPNFSSIFLEMSQNNLLIENITNLSFLYTSTTGFLRQLKMAYPLYPDVIEGLIYCCQAGLRGLIHFVNGSLLFLEKRRYLPLNEERSFHLIGIPLNLDYETSIDLHLWHLQSTDFVLSQTILNSPVSSLSRISVHLHELCHMLREDQQQQAEIDALKFAKYIQDQGKNGPDKEDEIEDCVEHFFPTGDFQNENDILDDNNDIQEDEKIITGGFELQQCPPTQETHCTEKVLNSTKSKTNCNFNQTNRRRFNETIQKIFKRLYENQHDESDEVFCQYELLTAALGFHLKSNSYQLSEEGVTDSQQPLVSALVRQFVHLLDEATTGSLHLKFTALFKGEDHLLMEDEEPEEDTIITGNATEVEVANAVREEIARYRSQKVKFYQLQAKLKSVKCRVGSKSLDALSFYSDAWPAACVLAEPVIKDIYSKSVEFIKQCDDHPVLAKIIELAESIERLPVFRTATISLVNVLELLLDRCHRWEPYAHRLNSLSSQITALRRVILLLRHQQLENWKRLRDLREDREAAIAINWLPELIAMVDCLIESLTDEVYSSEFPEASSSIQPVSENASKEKFQEFWSYLESKVYAASIGQFESRLHIIYGLGVIYRAGSSQKSTVGNMLCHFAAYSSLSRHKVSVALNQGRRAIDKEIRGLLKVTKWDFSRQQGVRDSLQKSHRQLGKAIRRFDEYLQEPVIHHVTKKTLSSLPGSEELRHVICKEILTENKILTTSFFKTVTAEEAKLEEKSCLEFQSSLAEHISVDDIGLETHSDFSTQIFSLRCTCDLSMTQWVHDLCNNVDAALEAVDRTTSSHKRRWVSELKSVLAENLQLVPIKRCPQIWLVSLPLGLDDPQNFSTLLLNKTETYVKNNEYCCLSINMSEARKNLPQMWEFSKNAFYKLLRRQTALSANLANCHTDMKVGQYYEVWMGLLFAILEQEQVRLADVWDFSLSVSILMDYIQVVGCSSYSVEATALSRMMHSIDYSRTCLSQLQLFIGSPYKEAVIPDSQLEELITPEAMRKAEIDLGGMMVETHSILRDLQSLLLGSAEIRLFRQNAISNPRISHSLGQALAVKVEKLKLHLFPEENSGLAEFIDAQPGIPVGARTMVLKALHDTVSSISVVATESTCEAPYSSTEISDVVLRLVKKAQNAILGSNDTTLTKSKPTAKSESPEEFFGVNLSQRTKLSDTFPITEVLAELKGTIDALNRNSRACKSVALQKLEELSVAILIGGLDVVVALGSLGLLMSRITALLFKTGFCGEKDGEVEEKNTKDEWQSGTGLGEGEGMRDISNDIENEDMMDGYKNEEEHKRESEEESQNKDAMDTTMDIDGELSNQKETNSNGEDEGDEEEKKDDEVREMGEVDLQDGGELERKRNDSVENEDFDEERESTKPKDEISTENGLPENQPELQAKDGRDSEQKEQPQSNDADSSHESDDEIDEAEAGEKGNQANVKVEKQEDPGEVAMDAEDYGLSEDEDTGSGENNLNDDTELKSDAGDSELKNPDNEEVPQEDLEDINMDEDQDLTQDNQINDLEDDYKDDEGDETTDEKNDKNSIDNSDEEEQGNPSGFDGINAEKEESEEDTTEEYSDLTTQNRTKMESQRGINEEGLKDNSTFRPDEIQQQTASNEEAEATKEGAAAGQSINDGPSRKSGQTADDIKRDCPRAPNPIKDSIEAIDEWLKQISLIDKLNDEKEIAPSENLQDTEKEDKGLCQKDSESSVHGLAPVDENTSENANEIEEQGETKYIDDDDEMPDESMERQEQAESIQRSEHEASEAKETGDSLELSNNDVKRKSPATLEQGDKSDSVGLSMKGGLDFMEDTEMTDDSSEFLERKGQPVFDLYDARSVWSKFERTTSTVSSALCEQLRIILEPTLKGRLHGDYKTGKRLSMRKVVAFIASNYRRDAIWLRRNKPSGRDYRIVVALDNSRSMSECGVGLKALEAVCAVCCAFQKLEIGKTGVCSFGGSKPEVILPLRENLYDKYNGAKILSSFTFSEESERSHDKALPELFNVALDVFAAAPLAVAGSSVQQMLLILSDGRFNKHAVKHHVEAAIIAGITPVLLIVDSAANDVTKRQSVINMKEARFIDNNVVVSKYLDDFPFQFYAIIDNVIAIPAVVGDVIRQWVEMLSRV